MYNKKIFLLSLSLLFCFIINPVASSISLKDLNNLNLETLEKNKEINLLRVEHYLELAIEKEVDIFNVKYAFPPSYGYQTPILLEILNNTTANIIGYKIENDEKNPNKIVNFTINGTNDSEYSLIHFTAWVLVQSHDFSDLPDNKAFPNVSRLPSETKTWLADTEVTQVESKLIKIKAKQFSILNNEIISYSKRVASFIKYHRYLLFILQLKTRLFFSQDAKTTLLINGENVGRAHLACALLRNKNIPSRVVLVNNDQGFWTQMHYMVEYYIPDYGWVLLDTTKGETPYDIQKQVINRICYPEDENDTKTDYVFKFMKGEERWIWIDNENVRPNYVDCNDGSKSQMFSEATVGICELVYNGCFDQTKETFDLYQKYLGMNISDENKIFFENSVEFQKKAINSMKNNDALTYYCNIARAEEEYNKIVMG